MKKADKIAEMFEWMGRDEGYMLCGFGRDGIEYTLDEKGDPVPVIVWKTLKRTDVLLQSENGGTDHVQNNEKMETAAY